MQTLTAPTQNGNAHRKNQQLPLFAVYKTFDYDTFKTLDDNRELNMYHVQRLIKSFEHKHLISPIIVNERFEVIDGQHRLEASKTTGLPIYYIQVNGYSIDEVQILNLNQKNWIKGDYLHMYCERGNKQYLKLREFMNDHPELPLTVCVRLLQGTNAKHKIENGKTVISKSFEEGRFEVKDESRAIILANRVRDFKDYCDQYTSPTFVSAFLKIFSKRNYSHKEMLHKLKASKMKIRASGGAGGVDEYMIQIENIYNWKRATGDQVNLRFNK